MKRTRKLAQTASQPKEANSRACYPKSKCELSISLNPAKTFDLTVSPSLLARTDDCHSNDVPLTAVGREPKYSRIANHVRFAPGCGHAPTLSAVRLWAQQQKWSALRALRREPKIVTTGIEMLLRCKTFTKGDMLSNSRTSRKSADRFPPCARRLVATDS